MCPTDPPGSLWLARDYDDIDDDDDDNDEQIDHSRVMVLGSRPATALVISLISRVVYMSLYT